MLYDETYANTKNNFGEEPEPVLRDYYHKINTSKPVLDIGAGQGRHAFFLARAGFEVDAIDPSKVAAETISALAVSEKLPVRAYQCSFDEFVPQTDFYSGILIFGVIQILTWKEIDCLRDKLKQWTHPGSLIFITGFTIADASFVRYSRIWKPIGKNSFAGEQGNLRTYLEAGEILDLFKEYSVVHHWEGLGPEHRHGNGPTERHAMAEVVLQR
ncbi:MAG TPA: class I SAM-dependent methyltransferase [Anaerolineales bacterium]|nr:class I SAM-dependent methyltransferase [Anaerolineales bacterium]